MYTEGLMASARAEGMAEGFVSRIVARLKADSYVQRVGGPTHIPCDA